MRTKVDPNAKDAFQQRAKEKDAPRDELFSPDAATSEVAKEYINEQVVEKPKRIKVGKPGFRGKF